MLAATWETHQEAQVFGNQVILKSENANENGRERPGTHSATIRLPAADAYHLDIDYDLHTWDSYAPYHDLVFGPFQRFKSGYYDLFGVSVSDEKIEYFGFSPNDGPRPDNIVGAQFTWGGEEWNDGRLESTSGNLQLTVPGDGIREKYLMPFLVTDSLAPSWGTFGMNLRDVAATELTFDVNGGVNFTYEVLPGEFEATPTINFYWASGLTKDTIIGGLDAPFYSYTLNSEAKLTPGTHHASIPSTPIADAPTDASSIIMVVDAFGDVSELIESNNHAVLGIVNTSPLHFELPAGMDWVFNPENQRFETDATNLFIGLDPKGNEFRPLIEMVATEVWYDRETVHLEGRFLPAIGPISLPLFEGTIEFNRGSNSSLSVIDETGSALGSFEFVGFEIVFTGIRMDDQGLGLQGFVRLPHVPFRSDQVISISGDHWLIINEGGVSITGGKLTMPDYQLRLGNLLDIEARNMSIEYFDGNEDEPSKLRLQGRIEIPGLIYATADLSGDNFIEFSSEGVELKGRFSVKDPYSKYHRQWSIEEIFFEVDTTTNQLVAGGAFRVPPHLAIQGEIGFQDGRLASMELGTLDNLNYRMFHPLIYLQYVRGGVDGLGRYSPRIYGEVGFTAGPQVTARLPDWAGGERTASLVQLDLTAELYPNSFRGTGAVKILEGLLSGQASVSYWYDPTRLYLNGSFEALDGLIAFDGNLHVDLGSEEWPAVTVRGDADAVVRMPKVKHTPLNGQLLAAGSVSLRYQKFNDWEYGYLEATGTVNLPFLGPRRIGFHVDFDGQVRLWGLQGIGDDSDAQGEFLSDQVLIGAETPMAILNLTWTNDLGSVPSEYELIAPDGTIYSAQDIASDENFELVDAFSSGTSLGIAINQPAAGLWRLRLPTVEGLVEAQLAAYGDPISTGINIDSAQLLSETLTINYSVSNAASAEMIDFYLDTDGSGMNGLLVGSISAIESAGIAQFSTADIPRGEYHVYATVRNTAAAPTIAYSLDTVTVSNHSPAFDQSNMPSELLSVAGSIASWPLNATDPDGDVLTYTVLGDEDSEFSVSTDGLLTATPSDRWLNTRSFPLDIVVHDEIGASDTHTVAATVIGRTKPAGTITAENLSNEWRFNVSEPAEVVFHLESSDITLELMVLNSENVEVYRAAWSGDLSLTLPDAGNYKAIVSAAEPGVQGDYEFRFDQVYQIGSTVIGYLNQSTWQTSIVDLIAGQVVLLQLNSGNDFEIPFLSLIDEQYQAISVVPLQAVGEPFVVPTTGRYLMGMSSSTPGFYSIQLSTPTSIPELPIGQQVSITLDKGDTFFRISVTEPTPLVFRFDNSVVNTTWEVYGILGAGVSSSLLDNVPLFFPNAGDFFIKVNATEPVTIGLEIESPPMATLPLTFGETYTQFDADTGGLELIFSSVEGQLVFIDFGPFYTPAVLIGPGGYTKQTFGGLVRVPTSGDYRLVVTYSLFELTVSDVSQMPVLPEGVNITDVLAPQHQAFFTLPAELGAIVSFDWSSDEVSGYVYSLNRNDNLAYAPLVDFADNQPRLVVLRNDTSQSKSFSLQANYTAIEKVPYTLGDSFTLPATIDRRLLIFAGAAGQRLFFDGGLSGGTVALVSPSQRIVVSRSAESDFGYFELPETGTYELLITRRSFSNESEPIRLVDVDADRLVSGHVTISGTSTRGTDSRWYSFDVVAGEQIIISDKAISNARKRLLLLDSTGNVIASVVGGASVTTTAHSTGDYLLKLEGEDSPPLSYEFDLKVGEPDLPPTDITLSRSHVFANLPGAWVATLEVVDPDGDDDHVFLLNDDRFEVRDRQLYIKVDEVLPAQSGSLTLTITASDLGAPGLSLAKTFQLEVQAAPLDWDFAHQWKPLPSDVNADGFVTPLDALLIVNTLNATGARLLPTFSGGTQPPAFLDVSGDGSVTVLDVALVISTLNAGFSQGQPEDDNLAMPLYVGFTNENEPELLDGSRDEPSALIDAGLPDRDGWEVMPPEPFAAYDPDEYLTALGSDEEDEDEAFTLLFEGEPSI